MSFFELSSRMPPYDLTIAAALASPNHNIGVDLGAGSGRETIVLATLFRNFIAVEPDNEAQGYLQRLRKSNPHLTVVQLTAEQWFLSGSAPSYGFLAATDVLPFLPPKIFRFVWDSIVRHLSPGGVFVGRVYGNQDTVNHSRAPIMTFLSMTDMKSLGRTAGLHTSYLEETYVLISSTGETRHLIDFVFRKR